MKNYIVSKNHPAFYHFKAAFQLINIDEMRKPLHYIKIEDNVAQSTNAHVLQAFEVHGIENNLYRIASYGDDFILVANNDDNKIKWPNNVPKIINNYETKDSFHVYVKNNDISELAKRTFDTDRFISFDYLHIVTYLESIEVFKSQNNEGIMIVPTNKLESWVLYVIMKAKI